LWDERDFCVSTTISLGMMQILQWEDVGYAQKHKETWEASGNIRPILLDTFPAESEEDVT